MSSDDLISQFMVFTGCDDGERALQYLEMSNMNVETAVSLYMEHEHQGSGAVDSALPAQVRAPDRTQTMRLMDDVGIPNMGMSMYDGMIEDQDVVMSAFARIDARSAVNAAAAEIVHDTEGTDHVDQVNVRTDEANTSANLTDLFAPPTHLLHRGGGFQGARTIARDVRRWLLVNIQRDSEFACHALNRDVWRDELVENLIREGFIFWQAVSKSGHFHHVTKNVFSDQEPES
jgi:UBX domain-containing protein 7